MNKTITSSNAIYMISVSDLFATPIQLQGFSADDIFTTQPLASAETIMGLDGFLSGGFVFVPVIQSVSLQADSASNDFFDQWYQQQQQARELYVAEGTIILPAVSQKWNMSRGYLTSYPPIPDAARTLRPRRYAITWNMLSAAPI